MFLGYQNGKIVLAKNTREELEQTACMVFDEIVQSNEAYVLYQGEYIPVAAAQALQAAHAKQTQAANLQKQLEALDLKAIRALRALSAGVGNEADKNKLEEIETQAARLRTQIQELL